MKIAARLVAAVTLGVCGTTAHSALIYSSDERYAALAIDSSLYNVWTNVTSATYTVEPNLYTLAPAAPYGEFDGGIYSQQRYRPWDMGGGVGQHSGLSNDGMWGSGAAESLGATDTASSVFAVGFTVDRRTDFSLSGALGEGYGYYYSRGGSGAYVSLSEDGREMFWFEWPGAASLLPFQFDGQFIEGRQYQLTLVAHTTPYFNSWMEWDFALITSPAVVPIPAAFWLFGSGFLCLVGWGRRRVS